MINIYWNKPHFTKECNITKFQTNTDRHTQGTVYCKSIMVLYKDIKLTPTEPRIRQPVQDGPHQKHPREHLTERQHWVGAHQSYRTVHHLAKKRGAHFICTYILLILFWLRTLLASLLFNVYNLRWRSIISKLEKSLNNIYYYVHSLIIIIQA